MSQPVLTPLTEAAIFLAVRRRGWRGPGPRAARGRQRAEAVGGVPDPRGRADVRGRVSGRPVGSAVRRHRARPGCTRFREIVGGASHAPSRPPATCSSTSGPGGWICASSWPSGSPNACGVRRVVDEVHGFRSFDERDLLGFVDGTENPDGQEADRRGRGRRRGRCLRRRQLRDRPELRPRPAGLGRTGRGGAGAVIGRTKLSDIEFPTR